jgi:hypothetical protein
MSNEQSDDSNKKKQGCSSDCDTAVRIKTEVYLALIGFLVSSIMYVASLVTELRLVEVEVFRLCAEVRRLDTEIECIKP